MNLLLPSDNDLLIELAHRKLRYFVRLFWPLIEQSMSLIETWHIDAVCDVLQAVLDKQLRKLVINIPPGHAKSNLASVSFPAFAWIDDPFMRTLYATYEATLAQRDSIRTRDVIKSELYQKHFIDPDRPWLLKEDVDRMDLFENTLGGFRLATTMTGASTGWRVRGVVVDDPIKVADAYSKAARDKANYVFTNALTNRLMNPNDGFLIVIMQRVHAEDLSGYLEALGEYEFLKLPSEYNAAKKTRVFNFDKTKLIFEDPRTVDGELLFPALYNAEALASARKTLGSTGYSGQHLQEPSPEEGNIFKRAYWRFWKPDGHVEENTLPRPRGCNALPAKTLPKLDSVIISVDAAFKDKKQSDHVCIGVIGLCKADKFVLYRTDRVMSFTETCKEIRRICEVYPQAKRKLIEDKANGSAIIDTLQSEITGIIAIEPEGGKESRAHAVSAEVESGNVYLPEGAIWLEEFIDQLAKFPNDLHDDQVDMLTQALIYLKASPDATRALAMSKW